MTNVDRNYQAIKNQEATTRTIVVLMQNNRLSPRLQLGEHVIFETNEQPELDCCVLTAIDNDLKVEIYNGTQTNIIGSEVARLMKRTKVNFSNIIELN